MIGHAFSGVAIPSLQLFTKKCGAIRYLSNVRIVGCGKQIGTAMTDFCGLLEAQIPPLRRYARALLRDASRADDLIQDTLVRALAKQHLWQEGTNLRAWLFTLMHNLHVNVVRQAVREGTLVDIGDVPETLVANSD